MFLAPCSEWGHCLVVFIDPYQIQHAIRNGISITAGGAVQLSAGTTSSARSDFTFNNSPTVTFGLDGVGVITASVAPGGGGLTNVKFSAGTQSALRSDITFSNGNGVTFGLNAGTITASVATNYQSPGAYLTTAMQSNAATISNIKLSAGTLSSLRSDMTFADSHGVVFGLNTNGVVTASVTAGGGGISFINFSAGTTNANGQAFSFDDTNGVNWGIFTNAFGTHITASVKTDYAGTGTSATNASITLDTNGLAISVAAPRKRQPQRDQCQRRKHQQQCQCDYL